MVVRGRPEDIPDDPPTAADTALVVEVADASPRDDRRDELAIYAAAGIPTLLADQPRGPDESRFTPMPTGTGGGPRVPPLHRNGPDEVACPSDGGAEVVRIAARDLFP